ncbi:hypothetical protein [Enterobacter sp. R1(2018)]|uniref:hypothetical protein n=1 Tax=Enterobacter sp. R1(2018) TaxID=2447891 RepID=UPI000EB334CA|nr:hypothetical protein [Enterobacter sp. R1(2018)]RKQ38356.1 hypothetical protein D8M09_17255 [Enterobacter sp. R1(2018)]
MDLSSTVVPRSDQINFEDVQSVSITAAIKSVRAGSKDQPVFIDLEGYDGRPYKPSKSMRRVLCGGWGTDGHSWVGRSLTLVGDPSVKFGGVAVGGIKVKAMSHIEADFSLMLTVSRGKRVEHRVEKLNIVDPLAWFCEQAITAPLETLERFYQKTKAALSGSDEKLKKLDEAYSSRKAELSEAG